MNDLLTITESCSFLLNNFPDARECQDYLSERISKETQLKFNFGYYPPINNLPSLTSIIGEDILRKNRFLFSKEIEDSLYPRTINFSYFQNYPLTIPFKDAYGSIVAIIARTLLSEQEIKNLSLSKYKNSFFDKKNHLFGLFENKQAILEQDCVYIVEGQFDVIKSYENNFKNVVALSCSSMSSQQFALITRYTNNLFLVLDNDDAGLKGRKDIVNKFSKFANIRNFYLQDQYKDIDDYFKSNPNSYPNFII